MIVALVLAAGRAERMGSPKLLAPLGGRAIVERVIAAAQESRCDEVLVVLGAGADAVGDVAAAAGARTVFNPRYSEGMATSVGAGVAALPQNCEAVVVLLGDQPFVPSHTIDALIDAHRESGRPIVASRYGAARGAPMLIARSLFGEVADLAGDIGARVLLRRHPDLVAEVDVGSGAAWCDIDTPDDLAAAERRVADDAPQDRRGRVC